MAADSQSWQPEMIKSKEQKKDGRYIIYYTFTEHTDQHQTPVHGQDQAVTSSEGNKDV